MALSLDDFSKLFLAQVAKDTFISDVKLIRLPFNYRRRIEAILAGNKYWQEQFSDLIDMDDFSKDHNNWDISFAIVLLYKIQKLGDLKYDFVNELMYMEVNSKAIENLRKDFANKYIHDMNRLVDLINDTD
jgi:hypothetical protein